MHRVHMVREGDKQKSENVPDVVKRHREPIVEGQAWI